MRWTCFSLAGSLQRKQCITCLDAVKIAGSYYEKNQVKKSFENTQNGILNNLECATESKNWIDPDDCGEMEDPDLGDAFGCGEDESG